MKLIKNDMYLLLIDEEAEIKEGWAINPDGNLNYFGFDWRATWTKEQILDCKNVIAYYPLTKEAKELDLPLLPKPLKTQQLPKKFVPEYFTNGDMIVKNRNGVRELVGTYKY